MIIVAGIWVSGSLLLIGGIVSTINLANKPEREMKKQTECLAKNMYFEVRNQGTAGMLAVSSVVINRVNDDRFPNTICKVVNQGGSKKLNKCQFSWHCDGVSDIPKNKKIYKKNLDFARKIMDNSKQWIDITDGSTFYHANYVRPSWRKKFIRTTEIDKHIFYRWNKK